MAEKDYPLGWNIPIHGSHRPGILLEKLPGP